MSGKFFEITPSPNNAKVFQVIATADPRFKKAVRQTLYRMGKLFSQWSHDLTKRGPRSGEFYKYKRRLLQASAPEEPPQRRSGFLRSSIGFEVRGMTILHFHADAPYASFLEDGTKKMKKRPFMMPAIKGWGPLFPVFGAEEMEKAMRPSV